MRVAVVGATGNCGTAVLRELAGRDEVDSVLGIARRLPGRDSEPYQHMEWATVDIQFRDSVEQLAAAFQGADAVIHLAWLIQPNSERELLRRVNVEGTRHVLEAAAKAGVGRIAVASSVGAYSPVQDDVPRDETWPTEGIPGSHYSVDKAAQERVMDAFEVDHPEVALARIRPGLVFQRDAGSEIQRYFAGRWAPVQLLRHVRPPVLPLPEGLRVQAVHSDDLALAYAEAVLRGAHGPFNVCADDLLDAATISGSIGGGRTIPLPVAPLRSAIKAAHRARLLPMDEGWLDMAAQVPVMDSSKARRDLGWVPRTSAAASLEELVRGMSEGEGSSSIPMRPRRPEPAHTEALPPEEHEFGEGLDPLLMRQYMADHLAGATTGLERIRGMAAAYVDTPVYPQLAAVAESIRTEQAFLRELMRRQGFSLPAAAAPLGWLGERVSRLKPYSRPPGERSPSALVLETELMLSAVTGKLHGWKVMGHHSAQLGVAEGTFEQLAEDAEEQRRVLEEVHEYARHRAFSPDRETFGAED